MSRIEKLPRPGSHQWKRQRARAARLMDRFDRRAAAAVKRGKRKKRIGKGVGTHEFAGRLTRNQT